MGQADYRFADEAGFEQERLAALERALDGPTKAILTELGIGEGWRCWDVGSGGGSVADWLVDVVGPDGAVLATDLADRRPRRRESGVRWLAHDILVDPLPAQDFDLVHARFLLEHLSDPQAAIMRIRDALRPGGLVVLEDSSGLQLRSEPASPAFDRLAAAWERAAHGVGWNASYGDHLVPGLHAAGLQGVRGRRYRQIAPGGENWIHVRLGIQRLRDELLDEGITTTDLEEATRCLSDRGRLITGPPVTFAWGRRPPG